MSLVFRETGMIAGGIPRRRKSMESVPTGRRLSRLLGESFSIRGRS
jgi:hypothetical protein